MLLTPPVTMEMLRPVRSWLPEAGIALLALFFTFRELGSFPAPWVDEGLFVIVAKTVASGRGYALPLLGQEWFYPYFLAVGPTVILPSALSLKLFGLSMAAARLPMALYLLATAAMVFAFTRRIAGRTAARWAALLLVTLSAFINTGKPVLGEVPAFLCLLLGLLALTSIEDPWKRGAASGVCFGLSLLTKLTYGVILLPLALAWAIEASRRKWRECASLSLAIGCTVLIYLPWRILEALHTPSGSLTEEISKFVLGGGDTPVLFVLRENREILLRLPFLAYAVFFLLGTAGLFVLRKRLPARVTVVIGTFIGLVTLYWLNGPGWYRHLLPAHLLLLPFVPTGARLILPKTLSHITLTVIILLQGLWQLDHRGSGQSSELTKAVNAIIDRYAETGLVIEQPEIYAQLPENPRWLFFLRQGVSPSFPADFQELGSRERCYKRVRGLSQEEAIAYGEDASHLGGRYYLLPGTQCAGEGTTGKERM